MDDLISRQTAIAYAISGLTREIDGENWIRVSEVRESIKALPSAQPEIKPIEYRDCANAMLVMWMDNVVTDGEYNRIMDKLNAYWRKDEDETNRGKEDVR